jgi:hypothetical protein
MNVDQYGPMSTSEQAVPESQDTDDDNDGRNG